MKFTLKGCKILFISPVFFNYEKIIIKKMESFGGEVDFYPEQVGGFITKLLHSISLDLVRLYQKLYFLFLLKKIKNNNYTHFFLIKGSNLPKSFVNKLKESNIGIKCIMYQWDSLKNNEYEYLLEDFDVTYTFDYKDFKTIPNLKFLQLFYTDDVQELNKKKLTIKSDYFCFFSFTQNRYDSLLLFIDFCDKNNFKLDYFCYIPYTSYLKNKYLKGISLDKKYLSFVPMSRNEYLEKLACAKIVVDISNPKQTGLSIKIIEAYGANKKLFTTNASILKNPIYSSTWVNVINVCDLKVPIYDSNGEKNIDDFHIDYWIKNVFSEN